MERPRITGLATAALAVALLAAACGSGASTPEAPDQFTTSMQSLTEAVVKAGSAVTGDTG